MSYEVLIEDLQRKNQDRIEKIWAEARHKADESRIENDRALTKEREARHFIRKEIEQGEAAPILQEAEKNGIMIQDDARRELADRLYVLAIEFLKGIRGCGCDYEKLFSGLVNELPEVIWQVVRVNPLDEELAGRYFEGVEIVPDSEIIGGFDAADMGGKYRVISSLEKRLERAWPYVLPVLLNELLEMSDAPAS